MGAFEYIALDPAGRSRKGVIEGDTARHVRSLLRERQLLPVTIEEIAEQESRRQRRGGFSWRRGVSASDLSLLTRQLSTLVRAGLPLEEALLAVEIEKNFSKQQILTLYLNLMNFGHGNYGVEAASRYYFGKPAKDLTVAEAATLVDAAETLMLTDCEEATNIAAAHSCEAEVAIRRGYPVTVNDAGFVDFARGVATELGSFAFFIGAWIPMMAAMMLPGSVPAVARRARSDGSALAVPLFLCSYLAVWTLVGVGVYAVYEPHGTAVAGALMVSRPQSKT